jgi:hypothetical protein
MAETIDEARIIAWIDGELEPAEAADVAAQVAADPELAALADRHRRLKTRFAAAFGPIAEPIERVRPATPVISLVDARAERQARTEAPRLAHRWVWPGAIAASLLLGVLVGHQALPPAGGLADRPGALALDRGIAAALDSKLSGEAGAIRIALSFRDKAGAYCRSFIGASLSGVACRDPDGWYLRYGAQGHAATSDYRTAGADRAMMSAVDSMIAGDPLDAAGEAHARHAGWR